ncbi:MAG TPA: hypothetical protein VFO69_08830 [Allosphingosinicella sp.]|nr:hypothetical protein [Allosphingosinicella sp.]
MTDNLLTRLFRSEGPLSRLAGAIFLPFCKLHQVQFDAPWNPRRRGC